MTRRTLKGGLLGIASKGLRSGLSRTGKVLGNTLVKKRAMGSFTSAISNKETFMGKDSYVHAYGLTDIAKKVFDFATKYSRLSSKCKEDDNTECIANVEDDRKALIKDLERLPPYENLYIKDPSKIHRTFTGETFDTTYEKTNRIKELKKEDVKFLFRLYRLLKKWKDDYNMTEIDNIMTKLKTYGATTESTDDPRDKTKFGSIFTMFTTPKGVSNITTGESEKGKKSSSSFTDKNKKTNAKNTFGIHEIVIPDSGQVIIAEEFMFNKKQELLDDFDKLYKKDYISVVENAKTSDKMKEESGLLSTVQSYVDVAKKTLPSLEQELEIKVDNGKYNMTKKLLDKNKYQYTIKLKE